MTSVLDIGVKTKRMRNTVEAPLERRIELILNLTRSSLPTPLVAFLLFSTPIRKVAKAPTPSVMAENIDDSTLVNKKASLKTTVVK